MSRYITDEFIAMDHVDYLIGENATFTLKGNIIEPRMRFIPKLPYKEISMRNMSFDTQVWIIDKIFPYLI